MRDAAHPAVEDITLTGLLAALSDPVRLSVVRLLADGHERAWGEIPAPVAKSTLSHHMSVLRAAGLTRTRREGTRCYVTLRRADVDACVPGLLDAVLAAPEAVSAGR